HNTNVPPAAPTARRVSPPERNAINLPVNLQTQGRHLTGQATPGDHRGGAQAQFDGARRRKLVGTVVLRCEVQDLAGRGAT
ncbi:MAG: hypothetical protein OEL91_09425, partial [Burkholderiaceae bacterium]|nr:hypothetical protein [Burkholderiaceae bacterium]